MSLAGSRPLFSLAFVAGVLAWWASFHLQKGAGFESCSLWTVQHLVLMLFTFVSLIAALQGPKRLGCLVYWLVNMFVSLTGALTAGRHVLVQNIPSEQLQVYLPDMPFMSGNLPWLHRLQLAFKATTECARITWTLFDMSAPEWSLLFFVAMVTVSAYQLFGLLRFAGRTQVSP